MATLLSIIPNFSTTSGEWYSPAQDIVLLQNSPREVSVYDQILRNKPTINKAYAKKLSELIVLKSKKYGIPQRVFTAILMQESAYKLNTVRTMKGLNKGIVTTIGLDYGIAQIYWKTIRSYGFNSRKLTTDLDYSLDAGAKVLSWFYKTYGKRERYWWVRYNVGTSKNALRGRAANQYRRYVQRYL